MLLTPSDVIAIRDSITKHIKVRNIRVESEEAKYYFNFAHITKDVQTAIDEIIYFHAVNLRGACT